MWPDLIWRGSLLVQKRGFGGGFLFLGFWDDHGRDWRAVRECPGPGLRVSGACMLRLGFASMAEKSAAGT
jgi:hypothetical protein